MRGHTQHNPLLHPGLVGDPVSCSMTLEQDECILTWRFEPCHVIENSLWIMSRFHHSYKEMKNNHCIYAEREMGVGGGQLCPTLKKYCYSLFTLHKASGLILFS